MHKPPYPLLPHQIEGRDMILSERKSYIADDMGLGKTATVIEAVIDRGLYPILVVCPASLKWNWAKEFETWKGIKVVPEDFNSDIVIINYENLKKYGSEITNKQFVQVVFDECHVLKNSQSGRGRFCKNIAKDIPYRVMLSGSPVLNRPEELVHQFDILGVINWFGGKKKFLDKYCDPQETRYGKQYQGFAYLHDLKKVLGNALIRRVKAELENQLPTKTVTAVPLLELPQEKPCSLEQIEKQERAVLSRKVPLSLAFIQEQINKHGKVVVFVHHQSVGTELLKQYPNACVIKGSQSAKARQAQVDKFQNTDCPIIICSLVAAAVGITLTAAHVAIFLEFPWSPTLLRQAQDRVHRIGQTKPVDIYYLYAKGSIDQYRLRTIATKEVVIDYIIKK